MIHPRPFVPHEYQRIARDFLLDTKRAALWAVPGLGKTSTVYSVLDILKLCGSNFFPVLVLAPLRVCQLAWPREQKKWAEFADLKIVTVLGERDVREAALLRKADVYVINYDNVQWLVKHLGRRWPFKIVVADESTKLKNFRAQAGSSGARANALSMIAYHTGRWMNLSGTPAPNGLKDLWGQTWFQDFGERLGRTYTAFQKRWFTVSPYTRQWEPRPTASDEIYRAVSDITLSLRAEDWLPVDKPKFIPWTVDLPSKARRHYDQMEADFFTELDGQDIDAVNSAVKSMKLLQMASGAVYDAQGVPHPLHEAKVEGLCDLVEELSGEPLILAYWFKWELDMVRKKFPALRVMKGPKDVDDWNAGRIPLMAVHPARGGHGLDMQDGGRAMVFFTQTWDLELRQQVIERIGPVRQLQSGHPRTVLVYDLLANNTMDRDVVARNNGKMSVQDALMLARRRRGVVDTGDDLI